MNLHELPKVKTKSQRIVGRGHGSGMGKTSGRGTKGQKARRTVPLYFEGGALKLIKRLPMLRGNGRNKVFKAKPISLNLSQLNGFSKGSTVDFKALVAKNIITQAEAATYGVKILGNGELSVPLTVKLVVSSSARKKIEQAGGKVEE
jgi:large subunit ribosomal protein L15